MTSITIHDVSSIKASKPREQDLELTETSYTKHFIIRTKEGDFNIILFADSVEALKME